MDDDIWSQYIHNIKPLKGRKRAICLPLTLKKKKLPNQLYLPPSKKISHFNVVRLTVRDFKKATFTKKLDLHGYTLLQAEKKVEQFLTLLQQNNHRYAIIITGKGKGSSLSKGVLCANIPMLFEKLAHIIIGYSEAREEDGGAGAFYIYLRKYRSK